MQRLSVFLFTSILGKNIYDEFDDVLGELKRHLRNNRARISKSNWLQG